MMNDDELFTQLGVIFNAEAGSISESTLLREDLHGTSMNFFAVSALLERASGKSVPYAEVNACKTVGDLLSLIA